MQTRLLLRRGERAASYQKCRLGAGWSPAFFVTCLVGYFLAFPFPVLRVHAAEELQLKWQPADASKVLGGFMEQRLTLSSNQPSSVKKLPAAIALPFFGELKIGPREKPGILPLVIDEPETGVPRFFLDSNGNGDLTDDPPITLTHKSMPTRDGGTISLYQGEGTVKIPFASGAREGRLGFTRVGRNSAGQRPAAHLLFYYRDYSLQGRMLLGNKSYPAVLVDEYATGDFRGENDPQFSGVRLFLDLNEDGRFDLQRESLDARKPFNVGGTTWEMTNMTAEGKFELVRSSRSAPELRAAPNLSRGAKAPSFTAQSTTGTPVKFPEDYRGKLVLLDFWATWCGPCLIELPNVVANYRQYHERGFEILGVSLDKAESIPGLANFTKTNNMSWKQICDGKLWQSDVAVSYGVSGIPFMLLVDGDTAEILGTELEVRAGNLGPAIEAGLARKKPPPK